MSTVAYMVGTDPTVHYCDTLPVVEVDVLATEKRYQVSKTIQSLEEELSSGHDMEDWYRLRLSGILLELKQQAN